MKQIIHIKASTLDQATSLLETQDAMPLAGGTDIVNALKMRSHPSAPRHLVDLTGIPGLDRIALDETVLKVGAMVKLDELENHEFIKNRYPILAQAAHAVASPQIRNMGTVAGNLCQEPRCWYYRYPDNVFNCLRKGGTNCPARNGQNQFHSIFGAAQVNAPPCRSACPGHTDIPGFLNAVRSGALSRAAALFLEVNPIPVITGRVCPHFCQSDCNRGEFDDSVSIRNAERFVGDYLISHASEYYLPPQQESGRRIAIIGSGPAGLSAAYFLRKSGHRVTVFDASPRAGGMLRGIPKYRLPWEITDQALAALQGMGIEFVLGTSIGKDIPLSTVRQEHEAVLLATGMWAERSIGLPGEDLALSGIAFLALGSESGPQVKDKRILVIGGGNVAMDIGVTARRLGASEVTVVCLERREEMPAYKEEIDQAIEEGVNIANAWGPSGITATSGGQKIIEVTRCISVFDEYRKFNPRMDRSITEQWQVDEIIMAVGQTADLSYLEQDRERLVTRGMVSADPATQRTSIVDLYAAGDAASGPGSVIGAIAAGKRAALSISHSFGVVGAQTGIDRSVQRRAQPLLTFSADSLRKNAPVFARQVAVSDRQLDREDASSYTREQVLEEANRCFNCGCVATNPSDLAPALIALNATIRTTRRAIPAEVFFHAGVKTSTVLDPGEILTGVEIPEPKCGTRQAFFKFSVRGAIDFAQVSAAVVLVMEAEKVQEARVVLGGVAPVPWRSMAAEQVLLGEAVTTDRATQAGEASIRDAVTLGDNAHVTRIVSTVVKRTILASQ